jgi:hypothetical protein
VEARLTVVVIVTIVVTGIVRIADVARSTEDFPLLCGPLRCTKVFRCKPAFGLTIVMSSVVTGREFGGVLVRFVADLAVFLGSRVVDVGRDGLTLATMNDARVCATMPPRVCALRDSGRSYLWMPSVRVCALSSPVRQVSCKTGAGRRLWIFDRGLGRHALSRHPMAWSWELMARCLPGTTPKTYILIGIGRCRSRVPKHLPTLMPMVLGNRVGSHLGARWNHADGGG